jgi:glycosyl transferase family 87
MNSRRISSLFFATLSLWLVLVAVVCLRVYARPGLHSVFTTYRAAGEAWIQQAEIYARTARTFLYSPLVAALYSPFALISQNLSEVLWRLLLGLAVPLALWFNARNLFGFSERNLSRLFLLILPLVLSSLNHGQANIIVLVLFLISAGAASQSRWWTCAFCASFAVYWKIYPIAFALLLVIVLPKDLTVRMLLTLIGLFGASLLLQKPSYVLREYASWFGSLESDRRRTLGYYGRWRDAYLLLRLTGIPISIIWWRIVQASAAIIAAGICLLGTIRHWPRATLIFGAMSLAIVWMLLFGPATEAATYVLIAVPAAYLMIFGWSNTSHPALRITSVITYLGFVSADILNSWVRYKGNVYLVHAIQPCFALCFCAALFFWWKQQLSHEGEEPSSPHRAVA